MKVERWGEDLAVQLPQELIDELGLQEVDEVELLVEGPRQLAVVRTRARTDAGDGHGS